MFYLIWAVGLAVVAAITIKAVRCFDARETGCGCSCSCHKD